MATMSSISDKIARVADLSNYTDITPEKIKKIFDDIGSSPEKLRAALNLWFVPDFKPTFRRLEDNPLSTLQDIEFLKSPDTERPQRPLRMIDIETGNIVDAWNISHLDSYCILSHRWKGDEITLAHIMRAREKHMERIRTRPEGPGVGNPNIEIQSDDIYLVLDQCKRDILDQEQVIKIILNQESEVLSVEELVRRKVETNEMKWKMNSARQARDSKKSMVDLSKIEKKMFDTIIHRAGKSVDGNAEDLQGAETPTTIADDATGDGSAMIQPDGSDNATTSTVVNKAEEAYAQAEKELDDLINMQQNVADRTRIFQKSNRLGDEVDELIRRLQRWKSAIKLDSSIKEARRIFQTSHFQKRGARYIWSDTCCIDKKNYGELSQSLSLMGDWYSNAEFCLVHLDTNWREADAIDDWLKFEGVVKAIDGKSDKVPVSSPNIGKFQDIKSTIEWASRAWTLQELVMSKMTFFVNSEWTPLSRPIEDLGDIYTLIPFIELHTRRIASNIYAHASEELEHAKLSQWKVEEFNALVPYLREADVELVTKSNDNHVWDAVHQSEAAQVRESIQIIAILNSLGFRFPVDMTVETATSEISRAVYLAASDLERSTTHEVEENGIHLLKKLKENHLPRPSAEAPSINADGAEEVITFLLACLVAKVRDLVVSDRRFIAAFGGVKPLRTWEKGIARSGFPAQLVLQLSCSRVATVPVDHVYSLMGILGVRFPSFHAEGYAKALARLLDEVIIAHNDVSVFNWAGAEMGSPVRGRTMYPASHKAYGTDEDRGRRYNMMISAKVRQDRKQTMVTYHGIIQMLRDAIDCVKDKKRESIPLHWVREVASFISNSTFENLQPQLKNIGKILLYIKIHCAQLKKSASGNIVQHDEPKDVKATEEKSSWSLNLSPSLPSLKSSSKKVTSSLPGFGLGRDKISSFGRLSSKPSEKPAAQETTSTSPAAPPTPAEPEWKQLDSGVTEYLRIISDTDKPQDENEYVLPQKIKDMTFKIIEPEGITRHAIDDEEEITAENLTCPNPIIVNSSGIEGIFDIQRIVVTMIDREKLVRQVAMASSPKQKISGWCTISTGFANVAVHFACEQRILRTQLDVEKATEDKIIKEDARAKKLQGSIEVQSMDKVVEDGMNLVAKNTVGEGSQDKQAEEKNTTDYIRATKEEKTIVRMLDYIQEPQLQLVAGEWVLARFSGVPGAKWFLCFLELGSTHQFYGQRIAATEIDFTNSAVEPGLMSAWQIYMDRKKRKLCKILEAYIKSSENAKQSEEKLSKATNLANDSYEKITDAGIQRYETARSFSSMSPLTMRFPFSTSNETSNDTKAEGSDVDVEEDNFLDELIEHAKEAALSLGHYTVLAGYEKFFEMQAQHLDKYLAVSVLKKTPKILQSAVENLDENKGFLPAMFHSGKRVHMF